MVGEEFCCLAYGIAKDFVADLVVVGSNSGMGGFFFGKILVVAEKWVEVGGWGFESVEPGI